MGDGLSSMFGAIGGATPSKPSIQGYIVDMRKSAEGIRDHRKFCIEMMKAYEKLTNKPFVYFNGVESNPEWQVVQPSERAALGTLGDGTVLSHTITLQQVNGTWRISSLFNERQLSEDAQPKEPAPSTAAAEMLQRLQGSWDVASLNFAAGEPRDLVVRDQLLLLPGTLLGKPIVTSMKLEWPNPNRPDEVDIIWDPINTHEWQPGRTLLSGRIHCQGVCFQLCFVDGSGKVTQRPKLIMPDEGIFYLDCKKNLASNPAMHSTSSKAE